MGLKVIRELADSQRTILFQINIKSKTVGKDEVSISPGRPFTEHLQDPRLTYWFTQGLDEYGRTRAKGIVSARIYHAVKMFLETELKLKNDVVFLWEGGGRGRGEWGALPVNNKMIKSAPDQSVSGWLGLEPAADGSLQILGQVL
ncbi:hypothetical protein PoB_005449400 [Plakobranchus ocellatus]|uniref:Uncharacterized protein n=1 Tax=Plakobranchus ocellatus TaxID=259542 RepID=A0AAV4CBB7_9GAST|nr:hypothetical protein PoB_005449400 [Plakobranchus ocellatus]